MVGNKITAITRTAIKKLFQVGVDEETCFETIHHCMCYCGEMDDVCFLSRLWDLKTMKSFDSRCKNAEEDIALHTSNRDYSEEWVFDDERLNLSSCSDNQYLKFLCEIFHPQVRDENKAWKLFYHKINGLLRPDGYELYVQKQISGRDVFSYRLLTEMELASAKFIPFSLRYKGKDVRNSINLKIPRILRGQIADLVARYDRTDSFTDETNWNYNETISQFVFDNIKMSYTPKSYNKDGQLVDSESIEQIIRYSSPYNVFDVIELYAQHQDQQFLFEINKVLSPQKWRLADGKIMPYEEEKVLLEKPIQEETLEDLLKNAENLFNNSQHEAKQMGLEKLWDALERIKTYYPNPKNDKQKSANFLVQLISLNNSYLESYFNNEFKELTKVGNNFQIRHFEKDKMPIPNDDIRIYLFKRCSALLNYAIRIINSQEILSHQDCNQD